MCTLDYIRDPKAIENRSFEIIEEHVDKSYCDLTEWTVIRRVIHTTADFEFADLLKFSPRAVESGLAAIQGGCRIYTDTRMVEAGINKKALKKLGCQVTCFVDHPQVAAMAKERGITRSMASIMMAAQDPDVKVFALGNAPTALYKLIELIRKQKVNLALIIGVPVGFVGAEESKDILAKLPVPYIITRGRKGGSTVAAAIVNALMYMAIEGKTHNDG
jgi:precorrin-8X/cobalt-precorrin-8 methylmutase